MPINNFPPSPDNPSSGNARKRPPLPPGGDLPPAKRPKPVHILPFVEPDAAEQPVEKRVVFPVVGELSDVEADYIRLWQQMSGYRVELFFDPDTVLIEQLTRYILQNAKEIPDIERGSSPDNPDVYREEVIRKKQLAFSDSKILRTSIN